MTGHRDLFEQAMRQGHSAAWDQQWERAIAAYRRALEEFPDDPNTLTSLGLALLQDRQLPDALEMYQRAAAANPQDFVAHEKAAEILERLGRIEEAARSYMAVAEIHLRRRDVEKAIDNWGRASRLLPGDLPTHSRLALAFERTNRKREAVGEYLTLARILQGMGEAEKSRQVVARALQLEPQHPGAQQALKLLREGLPLPAHEHRRGGTGPLRMAQVQAFIAPEPASADNRPREATHNPIELTRQAALTTLASMLFDQGEEMEEAPPTGMDLGALTQGRSALKGALRNEQATPKTDHARIALHLGQAIDLQTHGDDGAAAGELERAINAGLDHAAAYFNLGALLLEQKRPQQAIPHLERALANPDYTLGARYALGEAHNQLQDYPAAALNHLEALKLADLTTVAAGRAEELGQFYETLIENLSRQKNDGELKQTAAELSRFLSGEGWEERLRKARAQLDRQSEEGAVTPLADMLAVTGTEQVIESLALIDQHTARGFYATAMEEAYRALDFAPTYLPIHLRMAALLSREGRDKAALAKYTAVAETYRMRGNAAQAARILQDVVRLAPMDLAVRARLIETLAAQDRTDEALSQYLDMAEIYYRLADLDMARTTYANALKLAQRSSVDRAWSGQILHQMGDIDQQRLDWRQALRVYEQIKTIMPNDEKARELLINLNFRLGQNRQAIAELDDYLRHLLSQNRLDRSLTLLEELVHARPEEHGLRLRLAQVYKQASRPQEAMVQLDALAELQLDAGQTAEAARTVQQILALNPADAEGYRQLLARIQPPGPGTPAVARLQPHTPELS